MSTTLELHPETHVTNRCLVVTSGSGEGRALLQEVIDTPDWIGHHIDAGSSAIAHVLETAYDVLLLDWDSLGECALPFLRSVVQLRTCPPVVVIVDDCDVTSVVDALCEGAWSYLSRASVSSDLKSVIQTARRRREVHGTQGAHSRLLARGELILGCEREEVSPTVQMLVDQIRRVARCNDAERMRMGIALEEALLNAIIHGNLAIQSELRERDDDAFERLITRRRQQPVFRDRVVRITYQVTPDEARICIRDDGLGFDVSCVPDPTNEEYLTRPCGRGLLLMRTFIDEVTFNSCGNEVTLVKRFSSRDNAVSPS